MNANTEHIDLIARVLSGEANKAEKSSLFDWIEADEANKKLFNDYRLAWEGVETYQVSKQVDIDKEWKLLNDKISDGAKIISINKQESKRSFSFLKIAAIGLLVILSGFAVYYFSGVMNKNEIVTAYETKEIKLPDGSGITLNANSKVIYPDEFKKEKREVLLQGEAYFEVEPDKLKPFVVDAGEALIEVLGTSFNVKAYQGADNIEVIVKSGKVALSKKGEDEKLILTSGEKGVVSTSTGKPRKTTNTDINYDAYKTRALKFENVALKDFVRKISNVYHVSIVIESPEIENCPVDVSFVDQDIESVIRVFSELYPKISIAQKNDKVILRGKGCE